MRSSTRAWTEWPSSGSSTTVRWDFETYAEYLPQLRRSGSAVNLAAYDGHSSLRTWVKGAAAARREATPEEIAQKAALVREAMDAGAVCLASSTSPAHNGEGGLPMPSRLASDAEHRALIEAMAHAGGGVYMVTKGGQMPVALLEAMASALPVAATDVGDVARMLPDAERPYVVALDAQALAGAIGALAGDAPLRQRLGAANRARVEERFTFDAMLAAYCAVYESCAR